MKNISKPKCTIGDTHYDAIDSSLEIGVNPGLTLATKERILPTRITEITKGAIVTALVACGGACTKFRRIDNAQLVSVDDPKKTNGTYVHIPNICVGCNQVRACPNSLIHNLATATTTQLSEIEALSPGATIEI